MGAVANIKTENNVALSQMEKRKEDAHVPMIPSHDETLSPVWAENVAVVVADLRLTTENSIKQKISTSSCDLAWLLLACVYVLRLLWRDWLNTSTKINWQFLSYTAVDVYLPPLYYAACVCVHVFLTLWIKRKNVCILQ